MDVTKLPYNSTKDSNMIQSAGKEMQERTSILKIDATFLSIFTSILIEYNNTYR
jgi:hypothetical protein